MVQSLKVILWGEEIGRLAWDTRRRLSCFMYNPAFLKKGGSVDF
jgi:serine/threonine-protein kinase HipA